MSNKLDLIQDTIVDFRDTSRKRMTRIENDLKEHKEGVMQNRSRIEKLEEPRIARKLIIKWIAAIGTVAGTIYTIAKLMGKI